MTPFARAVLDVVDRIPPGRVLTYAQVAAEAGAGRHAARAVGAVLGRYGDEVPWWRVVTADGRPHADAEPRLRSEGVSVLGGRVVRR